MTLITSANLIGLACVGTATSNNKLSMVDKVRNIRVLMWLGTLLKSFKSSNRADLPAFGTRNTVNCTDTARQPEIDFKPVIRFSAVLPVRETELMCGVFQFQEGI